MQVSVDDYPNFTTEELEKQKRTKVKGNDL